MNEPIKQQADLHSIFSKIDAEVAGEAAPDFRPPSARAVASAPDSNAIGASPQHDDEYDRIGALLAVLFPNGLHLDGEAEFAAFYLHTRIVEHMSRFSQRGMNDPQAIHGASTYSAVLENRILRKR